MPDLTKLQSYSETPAFLNRDDYSTSFAISGTVIGGVNTRQATITLPFVPILADVTFSGRGDVGFWWGDHVFDPRPSNAWFKEGAVWARGDSSLYSNEGTQWRLSYEILGTTLTIFAICVQQFDEVLTLTSENVQVKVVDYASA